jgi:hypothetical protein
MIQNIFQTSMIVFIICLMIFGTIPKESDFKGEPWQYILALSTFFSMVSSIVCCLIIVWSN